MAARNRSSGLRDQRRQCGLTQAELASRAGVSRQLVAAVEAGHNTPAVDTALALAGALGTSVEALFGAVNPPDAISALDDHLAEGVPLRVGRVGEQLVAAELADHGVAGPVWAKSDGIIEAGRLRLFPGPAPAGLVLAGCDPALGVAEAMLQGLGPSSLLALSAGTGTALRALARGCVHAAVVHGPSGNLPEPPVAVVRWQLARWPVGLAVTPKHRRRSLEAWLQGRAPIAQRDASAASQQALERAARRAGIAAPTSGPRAAGHLDAARLAATLGCAGLTTESAAAAFALYFHPLEEHEVQIWVEDRWLAHPGVASLGDLLASSAFTQRVAGFGGYDLSGCGSRL